MRALLLRISLCLPLCGCTAIYIAPGDHPVNVQTTDSVNVMGSQNVVSSDKASKGDASSADNHDQKSTAVPVMPTAPINLPR